MEAKDFPNSSNIDRLEYFPGLRELDGQQGAAVDVLVVYFKNGGSYAYWTVSAQQWAQLRDCQDSIGRLFDRAIRRPTGAGEYVSINLGAGRIDDHYVDAREQREAFAALTVDVEQSDATASVQTHSDAVLKAPDRRRLNPRR